MSAKVKMFNDEIIPLWNDEYDFIQNIDTSILSNDDSIKKLIYLKKINNFLKEAINNIDPDYIPKHRLGKIKNELNYIKAVRKSTGKTIDDNLKDIGDYFESLLEYFIPFLMYKNGIRESKKGLSEYFKAIENHANNGFSEIKSIHDSCSQIKNKLEDTQTDILASKEKVDEFRESVFSDNGLKIQAEMLLNDSKNELLEIEELYKSIFKENGTNQKIDEFYSNISKNHESIKKLMNDSSNYIVDLKDFYADVFGSKDKDGKQIDGLKQEIELRRNELDDFAHKQQEKYNELNKQIESLLPGATSAGLSSAYNGMKDKFDESAKLYGGFFYVSLVIFLGIIVVINICHPIYITKEIPFDKGLGISLLAMLGNFMVKLPFTLPALWLSIFLSKRRSEAERLAQEYAHKEALAKSYDSYKTQIEKLSKEDQEKLLPVLMESMIKAIAFNPAKTLDKKNKNDKSLLNLAEDKNLIGAIVDKIKDMGPSK